MADNIATTPGSGATIAADDVGGILHQRVKLGLGADGAAADLQGPDADGLAASRNLPAGGMHWNGASFDRQRGNTEGTLLASAARTTTTNSANQTNYNHRGVYLSLRVTAASGTGGLTLRVIGFDPVSGLGVYISAAPTAVTTTGLLLYELYPGTGAASGDVAARWSASLPRTWGVQIGVGDASSYTYSVGYMMVV